MTIPALPFPAPQRSGGIDPAVVQSIRQASTATNVDFGFLMAQAAQESGFQTNAKAAGSTATGLFQFVDQTWLQMVQRFGAKYGIGHLAQQITLDDDGRPHIADSGVRQQILELRKNPALASDLAAEYARLNQDEVEHALGRKAGRTDLYMAHFLGASGATEFLKAEKEGGAAAAADILPDAAAANPSVFYDKATGAARTVSDIYRAFAQRIEQAASSLGAGMRTVTSESRPGGGSAESVSAATVSMASTPTAFLRRLGLGGGPLSEPILSMLDVFTMTTLKLFQGDQGSADQRNAERIEPPPLSVPAAPANPALILGAGSHLREI